MCRRLLTVLILAISLLPAQLQAEEAPHVTVSASLQHLDADHAQLTVTAEIKPGLHVYAQSQPKPFLATQIDLSPHAQVTSHSAFIASQTVQRHQHPSLDVEIHELTGTVQWTSKLSLSESSQPLEVPGTVFAQACEEGRCFAPQTYTFVARLDPANSSTPQPVVVDDARKQAPDSLAHTSDAVVIDLPFTDAAALASSLSETSSGTNAAQFDINQIQTTAAPRRSSWVVLPFAFLAGFLLNFMPCVLPVVGLKLLSFVQQANSDRRRILLMNLAYTAGLLSVMLVLATLAGFAGLGWGEQFSSPAFTITLAAIVFAFGLSFLGVWEIRLPGFMNTLGGTSKQEGYGGAFSKGILSTLLATPCSGPFLGAALAWAVTQPVWLTYAVFISVGLGMASPYLVVGMFPALIRFLPKPGNWMITFKQVMGFIMLGTVVYLMSFMPEAAVVPTALFLLGLAVALWLLECTPLSATRLQHIRSWSLAVGITAATAVVSFGWLQDVMQGRFEQAAHRLIAKSDPSPVELNVMSTDDSRIVWQEYSPERLESLVRAGRPVFVDFTADWCLTCKANEAAAVDTAEFAAALNQHGVVALKADKTEPNPQADALLRNLGNAAASIPFYAYFSKDHPQTPTTFDGVFTSPDDLIDTVTQESRSNSGRAPHTAQLHQKSKPSSQLK